MSAIELNWNPTTRQLRQFGALAAVGFPLAGWLFSGRPGLGGPGLGGPGLGDWSTVQTWVVGSLAALGVGLAILGWLRPAAVKPVFLGVTLVTFPIGLVLSEVILLLIYVMVFVPVGLWFKLIGRDALERTIDRDAPSYWQPKQQPNGPKSYFRQS